MPEAEEISQVQTEGAAAGIGPLSIGEVLAVLTEEFPDITISKIRFLESQGLVEPERNASGYRQFRDADIERLRWILRQQRDHFLPLKVIRRALERGVDVIDAGAGDQPTLWTAVAEAAAAEELERRRAETIESEAESARRAAMTATHPTRVRATSNPGSGVVRRRRKDEAAESRYQTAADVVAALQEGPEGATSESTQDEPDPEDTPAVDAELTEASAHEALDTSGDLSRDNVEVSETITELGAVGPSDESLGRSDGPAEDVVGADHEPTGPNASGSEAVTGSTARTSRRIGASSGAGIDTEAAMRQISRDELIDEVGIDDETLDQLAEFGLVDPVDVAGEALYGARDIEIARLAKRGTELGFTPRHLRIYKVAADRESGLLEQVAMPLLKQRNPAARERAASTVAELSEIGAALHAALLAQELGPNLDPEGR